MTPVSCQTNVARQLLAALSIALLTFGCGSLPDHPPTSVAPGAGTAAHSPGPPTVQPYDKAVLSAATALFNNTRLPPEGTPAQARYTVVIDPLIDGMTGQVTATLDAVFCSATPSMGEMF